MQATGAHPYGGMTLSQMKTLFERSNVSNMSNMMLTKEKLGYIIEHLKGSNGGLVRAQCPRNIAELRLMLGLHDHEQSRNVYCLP